MDDVAVRVNMGDVFFLVRALAVQAIGCAAGVCLALARSCRDPVRGFDVFVRCVGSLLEGLRPVPSLTNVLDDGAEQAFCQ
jgi:hypothetical protein